VTARMLAWKQPSIQRVRNSSLVERQCIDNNRALRAEPKKRNRYYVSIGRGAFRVRRSIEREPVWSARKSKCRHK
jgi:hypothetical protein